MASPAPGIWSFRDGVYLFRSPRDLTPVYRVMKKNSFLHVEPEDVNDVADHGDRRSSSSPPEVRRRADPTESLQPTSPSVVATVANRSNTSGSESSQYLMMRSSTTGSTDHFQRSRSGPEDELPMLPGFVVRSTGSTEPPWPRSLVPSVPEKPRWCDHEDDDDDDDAPLMMKSNTDRMDTQSPRSSAQLEVPPPVPRSKTSDDHQEVTMKQRVEAQHAQGTCLPCIFFMKIPNRCRLGDECTHCHLCTYEEARRRRNRISGEKRKKNYRFGYY